MPHTISFNDFRSGWIPADDAINGRKNGLLQMDNVELDINGALALSGGTKPIHGTISNFAHTMFSRVMNGVRNDYTVTIDGNVYRNSTVIVSGGDARPCGFGTAFDFTLIACGDKRFKDDGNGSVGTMPTLGVQIPTSKITVDSQRRVVAGGLPLVQNVIAAKGSITTAGVLRINPDATSFIGAAQSFAIPNAPVNMNQFSDLSDTLDSDPMYFIFYFLDIHSVIPDEIQIDILLDAPPASGLPVANTFTFKPIRDDYIPLPLRDDNKYRNYVLKVRRDQFLRVGGGTQGWETVYGYRITYKTTAAANFVEVQGYNGENFLLFIGGVNSQDGIYEYAQMNVNNTGSYLAKSELGPASDRVHAEQIQSILRYDKPVDPQVNEVWIFRRSVEGNGLLDQWYRVQRIVKDFLGLFPSLWLDNTGDLDAIILNITVNLNLKTIAAAGISEKIFDIIGPVSGRWYYFTPSFMYPSDINNPDLVDVSIAIRTTGSKSELFMWARKVNDSVILVGTTNDIYLLTGTFATLPDDTVDIYYRPLSCAFPPVSHQAVAHQGSIYYLADDGWRAYSLGGGNPLLTVPNTDVLYRNIDRYGYTVNRFPLEIGPGIKDFPIVVAKNKLWCFLDDNSRFEVWDFARQYWRNVDISLANNGVGITAATATEDGSLIAAFEDFKIRELDQQPDKRWDASVNQTFKILTPVLDGGFPKQRKDTYTLKCRCYTGNGSIDVRVIKEDGTILTFINGLVSPSRVEDRFIDISTAVGLAKTYQIQLIGILSDVLIDDITIECDVRPVQVSFLRVQSNNYGTSARKRLFSFPFVIDTLGTDAIVVPYKDNLAQPGLTVNSNYKASFTYKWPLDTAEDINKALDFEFTIHSPTGLFEFFGFQEPRNFEVFPEQRLCHVIPVTNLGSARKKRIRVWPFSLDTFGANLTFFPLNDGVAGAIAVFNTIGRRTVRYYFTSDVFSVYYSGVFSCPTPWELWEVMEPTIVQTLPIAKQFDQVGPQEFFKYGKIKQFEIRILPFGGPLSTASELPIRIFFNDNEYYEENMIVQNAIEASYFIGVPKGVAGEIVRIEIGPTCYDFHRFYMRAQTMLSGRDTDLTWVTLVSEDYGAEDGD